jgi:phage tail-like protein
MFRFINAFASRSTTVDPATKAKFRVSIPGLPTSIGFQKCSGLSLEVGVSEYEESGFENTHKLVGRQKVEAVTLERGVYADTDMMALVKSAMTNPDIRNTIIIEHLTPTGVVARKYQLAEAWVSKWEGSDLDASSDDAAIEKITIQFEYYM